jgi:hypothetical protein
VLWAFLEADMAASNKPLAHQLYEVIRALRIWGKLGFVRLRFVFDALTMDNSTGIRRKWKKSVPRYSTNLRRIIGVGSPENRRWKNIWLLRIRHRIWGSTARVHVDCCISGILIWFMWSLLKASSRRTWEDLQVAIFSLQSTCKAFVSSHI